MEKMPIKILSWDFLIFFFYVLWLGHGSDIVGSYDPRVNLTGMALLLFSVTYLVHKNALTNFKEFYVVCTIVILWSILHFFVDTEFSYLWTIILFLKLLVGYIIVRSYGKMIILYFEKSIVILSAISLLCWGLSVIFGPQLLASIAPFASNSGNADSSFLVYTIFAGERGHVYGMGDMIRNSGFAWEPGLFASILVFAIFFNILKNDNRFLWKNRSLQILILTLITTFSTTGYVSFLIIMALHLVSGSVMTVWKKILTSGLLILIVFYVNTLPFMSEKIYNDSQSSAIIDGTFDETWAAKNNMKITAGRFEGISLDLMNVHDKPILGYGFCLKDSYVYKNISYYVLTSNGLVKPIAIYGIPLFFLFLMAFISSSKKWTRLYHYRNPLMMILIFIAPSISYSFIEDPIYLAIMLYSLFSK